MTVGEWVRSARRTLEEAGFESARIEADLLAGHVLGVGREWLFAHPEAPFPELAGLGLLQRRLSGEPIAYLLGRKEFMGHEFQVRPGVLIPRPETEVLVEVALDLLSAAPAQGQPLGSAVGGGASAPERRNPTVLDLCCGSGCIGISIALARPDSHVVAVDLDPVAVAVTQQNAERLLSSDARFECRAGDLYDPVGDQKFSAILCNPPYIAHGDPRVDPQVHAFEPSIALYAEEEGLNVIERVLDGAPHRLSPDGFLLLEMGEGQEPAVVDRIRAAGLIRIKTYPDLAGIPRTVLARLP